MTRPVPLTRDEANAFIVAHHRHHGRVTGHRFIVGAERDGVLVGCAVAGRAVARALDQKRTVEINRVATDGTRNTCSLLYGTCARVARDLGFRCCFTYQFGHPPVQEGRPGSLYTGTRIRQASEVNAETISRADILATRAGLA